ncbi:hypothetical protein ABPG75_008113 [Micractinium tetrahymenae]
MGLSRSAALAHLLACCLASLIAVQAIASTLPAADAPQQHQPVAHAAAAERAPGAAAHSASNASSPGSQPLSPAATPLRLWIDDFFFAEGETTLLKEAIAEAGVGTAVLAGVTRNRVLQLKSYQQTGKADVLWTGRLGCYEAFKRRLNASHAVSCVPGTQAVSDKAGLAASLEAAYGPAAGGIVPRSFRLPQQYTALAAHIKQEQRSGRSGGLWVLKEDAHRGKGVGVVSPPAALLGALQRAPGGRAGSVRHVLAQRFLENQLLIDGRPFYIRLWAVLMGADPARAYLFDGGVVVFGQRQRAGQSHDALIVNLWTQDRSAAAPWSLGQLEAHLAAAAAATAKQDGNSADSSREGSREGSSGPGSGSDARSSGSGAEADAVRRLRPRLHAGVAASLASALPSVRRSAAALPGFQGGSFEVLGVDFLVDASLRPWLVEVNFLPSMARKLVGCNATSATAAGARSSSGDAGSSTGASSGSASDGDSGGSSGGSSGTAPSAGACQQDNPFDVQKERFVRSLLGLLAQRHRQLAPAQRQPEQLLQAASAAAAEGEAAPCLDAGQLRQVAALPGEQAAAEALGFVPLTELMYRCLECAASWQQQQQQGQVGAGSGDESPRSEQDGAGSSSGVGGGSECAVLAELAPPPEGPAQAQQQRQQCSAPTGRVERLRARLRRWRERLFLEGAALAPWVLNPKARWQAMASPPPTQPFPLLPADQRMLAWLRRGSPPLDSPQAVQGFCAAAP